MNKKRIVIVSMYFPPDKNGMAVYAGKLFNFLHKEGHDVEVITRYLPQRSTATKIQQIKFFSKELKGWANKIASIDPRTDSLKFSQEAYNKIPKNIDCVHCLSCWDDYLITYPYIVNKRRDYKLILTIGGGGTKPPVKTKKIRSKILNKLDVITFLSHRIKNNLTKLKISKPHLLFTPPSINHSYFSYSKPVNKKMLAVLYAGRIDKQKGVLDIVKIAHHFNENYKIRFRLIGVGDEKQNLKSKISNMNLKNIKILPGVKHNKIVKYFQKADIFLHPTYDDEFPVSVLEALSCGLPVISTLVGEIPKLIEEKETGFLCKPGDIKCFVRSIKKILDIKIREKMGKKARKIAKKYSEKNMFNKYRRIYQSLFKK